MEKKMSESSKPAVRGMLLYLGALLSLGLIAGVIFTLSGRPSNPSVQSAGETIPEATALPQQAK
jgi:hypothetical protein